MLDYSPLWRTMKQKKVSQYRLLKYEVINNRTLARIKKNENMTLLTMERLCKFLNCTPNDIVAFTEDD